MTPEEFVTAFVDHLHRESVNLRSYGAEAQAATCEKNAADLGSRFRVWWLESLTIAEAARESGYAEESLRQMAREGRLSHGRAGSETGPFTVKRCDLPIRPKPKTADKGITVLADRLLGPMDGALRKPA